MHYQLGCYLSQMKRSYIEASLVNANYRTRPESASTCDSAVSWKFRAVERLQLSVLFFSTPEIACGSAASLGIRSEFYS